MAGVSGADVDELEQLGRRMEAAADRLSAIRDEVTAVVRAAHWEGGDALDFRDQWQFRLSGLLYAATTATRDAGLVAVRNAQEQRAASGADLHGGPPNGGDLGAVREWDLLDTAPFDWLDHAANIAGLVAGVGSTTKWMIDTGRAAKLIDNPVFKNLHAITNSPLVKGADDLLGGLSTTVDLVKFGSAWIDGDYDGMKLAGADLAFDAITAGVMFACPPLGLAFAGGQVIWGFLPEQDRLELINGVIDAGASVIDAGATVVDAGVAVGQGVVDVAEDVGGAVSDIAEGGFNAVRGLFGR